MRVALKVLDERARPHLPAYATAGSAGGRCCAGKELSPRPAWPAGAAGVTRAATSRVNPTNDPTNQRDGACIFTSIGTEFAR